MKLFSSKYGPYFLCFAATALLVLPFVLTQDMFIDGLIYSTISNNLANGEGTFWAPVFSGDIMTPFHEHPPLVFGIQSLFFSVLGDGFLTERIYDLTTLILGIWLIHLLWKEVTPQKEHKLSWLPILFWIITPHVFWSYHHNMLENTMVIFSLVAVLAILRANKQQSSYAFGWLFIASLALFGAFLSKGFVGVFPLVLPIFLALFGDRKKNLVQFGILVLLTALIPLIVFPLNTSAYESISTYLETQVAGSLKGERVVVRRTLILEQLILDLLPAIGLTLLYYFTRIFRKGRSVKSRSQHSMIMLLIGLSASVPIMVSPKQLAFYIVPSIPFFATSLALLISSSLRKDLNKKGKFVGRITGISGVLILSTATILSVTNFKAFHRDVGTFNDIKTIASSTDCQFYQIDGSLGQEWSVFAYFKRYHSLDCYRGNIQAMYLLVRKGSKVPDGYSEIDLETKTIILCRRD